MATNDNYFSSSGSEYDRPASGARKKRSSDDILTLDDVLDRNSAPTRMLNDFDAPHQDDSASCVDIRAFANAESEPCMLSDDERRCEEKKRIYSEGGCLDENYTCELCRIGDGSTDNDNALAKVYKLKERYYKRMDDALIFEAMAKTYNETVYDVALLLDARNPLNLIPWTRGMVEYHYEVCVKSDHVNILYDEVHSMTSIQKWLKGNMFRRELTENGTSRKTMNVSMVNQWLKIHKAKSDCLQTIARLDARQAQNTAAGSSSSTQGTGRAPQGKRRRM